MKTKHSAQSYCHIAISAKVKEYLKCICNSTQPAKCYRERNTFIRGVKSLIGNNVLKYIDNNFFGVMDADGNRLTEAKYDNLYGNYGYVEATIYNGTVNCVGLLNVAGQELIPCQYGNIDMENAYWAV